MIVQRKVRKKKYVSCTDCKAKGIITAATCYIGSELIAEKPLCVGCKERIEARPLGRVGHLKTRALLVML
jgi:hypothetical protein